MNRKFIIVLFVTISCFTAYGSSVLDNYFFALKNLDYQNARIISDQIENIKLKKECIQLVDVLYYSGQKKIILNNPEFSTNSIENIISNLAKGYHVLFSNPYTTQPFEHFQEAYNLSLKINHKSLTKLSLLAILQVYNSEVLQSNDDILYYLKKMKDISSDNADLFHYKINLLLFHLRDTFLNLKIDETYILEFDALMKKFDANHNFWPKYYSTVGVLYEALNKPEIAIKFHNNAIKLITNEPYFNHLMFRSNIRLAEIMKLKNEYHKAINYINKARNHINLSDSIRSKYYINRYLSYNYFELKDFKNAYSSLNNANELSAKLDYKKNSLEIARLNVKYQTQEKELQILKEQEQKNQNRNIAISFGGLLLFSGITFFLIQKNTKRKQKLAEQETLLETQKVATLLKEQELKSIDAMIEGQEKERQRIANDLHDNLGSMMATLKLHFENLQQHRNSKDANQLFSKTNMLIDDAYQKVRTIAHAKNSGVIAKQGLLKAVQTMADKISIDNKIEIDVIDYGLENRLENSLELTIFRIIQELITNIIKHAKATQATIHLTNHEDILNIMIEDNGIGFKASQIYSKNDGMGINSIDKRVEHLNGSMTIESDPKQGTTIIIDLPL